MASPSTLCSLYKRRSFRNLRPCFHCFQESEELANGGDAMLPRGVEDGLAQGDGLEVVAAADLRLGAVFQSTEKLGHGAGKSIGEPHLRPARLKPVAGLLSGREVE